MPKKPKIEKDGENRFHGGGGLIVVCGPPFGGKNMIGTRIAASLPYAVKLEAEDELSKKSEVWYSEGRFKAPIKNPQDKMLEAAALLWEGSNVARTPVVVLVARFSTPATRRRAYKAACAANVKFLLVQSRSANLRVLRQVTRYVLSAEQATKKLKNVEEIVKQYKPVTNQEAKQFPCLRLKGNVGDLDQLFASTLYKWIV